MVYLFGFWLCVFVLVLRGELRPPQAPRRRKKHWHMCKYLHKFTQNARLIRSSCKEHRIKHRENLLHITAWMSARMSTLRNVRMLKSIDSPPYHRNFRSSLQQERSLRYLTYQGTIQQLRYNSYATLYSHPKTKSLVRPFQCLLLGPCKGVVENSGRFTKDVKPLCKINAFFPVRQRQPHEKLKACDRKLAAGRSLDPGLGREAALALDSLLHSTAIARPRTIGIMETTNYSVFGYR